MRWSRRIWLQQVATLAVGPPLLGTVAEDLPTAEAARFLLTDDDGQSRDVVARVVVTAQDGSLLLQGQDGVLWAVGSEQIQSRSPLIAPWRPLTPAQLGEHWLTGFAPEFRAVTTEHYVLVTNTSAAYANWCGALFERLRTGFVAYWKERGFELAEPDFALPVVIFATQAEFAKFATKELGEAAGQSPGFYSILNNRIALYDLTATGLPAGARAQPAKTPADVQSRLETGRYNIATIVHEATHQIAFNSGMHVRLADNPLWLTEGMAMFFEPPDTRNKTGWRTAGILNRPRLAHLRQTLNQREPDSLAQLLRNDERLSAAETAEAAYAESWGLTYYLIKKQPEQYVQYLQGLQGRVPLVPASSEERLKMFETSFGPLADVEQQFLRYIRSLGR